MENLLSGQVAGEEATQAGPSPTFARVLAAAMYRLTPELCDRRTKLFQSVPVAWDGIILVPTPYNLPKPDAGLVQWIMHTLLQLLLDLRKRSSHSLCYRDTIDRETASSPGPTTAVIEAKKVETLRLALTTVSSSRFGVSAEFDQTCLPRVQFQVKPSQSLTKLLLQGQGVDVMREADDKVICVPDHVDLSDRFPFSPLVDP